MFDWVLYEFEVETHSITEMKLIVRDVGVTSQSGELWIDQNGVM